MGVTDLVAATDAFFAGSMFLTRTKALLPLATLGFVVDEFEPEQRQINGTLAHAIERAISYSAEATGLRIAVFDLDAVSDAGSLVFEGHTHYPYVARQVSESPAEQLPK